MGFFSDKCPNPQCGATVRRGASFCPECGQPAPRGKTICPACGNAATASARYCSLCGAPIRPTSDEAPPLDALNRWKRAADQFAQRIEASDLRGMLQRGLVVEPGTQALIFQAGALAAVVSEGTYDLNRPMEAVDTAAPATAILIDAGHTRLPLLYRGLNTREDVPVELTVDLVVKLEDAAALHANLMHGRQSLSISALAELLWTESANVVQAYVKQAPLRQLEDNLQLSSSLESDLRKHITEALRRNGLALVHLRSAEVSSEAYDEVRRKRTEAFLAEQRTDTSQRRAQLNRRIRETLTQDRMHKFTSAKDLEEFIHQTEHELGMKDVVRQEEMDDLKHTFQEKAEDAEITRRHLLEKLELEHSLAVMRQEHALDDEQFKHTQQQERESLRARHADQWETFKHQQQMEDQRRSSGLEDARTEAEKKEIKIKMAGKTLELHRQKAALEDEEEARRIARQEEVKDRQAKRELEKIRTLSDVEQARLAVDLKKTEVMKDLSEEQILALMAKDSPHVAAAIAERAKAQAQAGAGTEFKALYDRILTGKEAEADRLERVMDKAMQSMERVAGGEAGRQQEQKADIKDLAKDSMDRMADVAAAKAGTPAGANAQAAEVVCPKCRRQVPARSKFCDNCGHRLSE